MSAYLIVDITRIRDEETYSRYRSAVSPGLEAAGGRYLARGGVVRVLEGQWQPGRLVLVRFDTPAAATKWWESDAYAPLREIRRRSTDTNMVVVEGLERREDP